VVSVFAVRPVILLRSLHDALPISPSWVCGAVGTRRGIGTRRRRTDPLPAAHRAAPSAWSRRGDQAGRSFRRLPVAPPQGWYRTRSEEPTSELQSRENLVCRLLLEK